MTVWSDTVEDSSAWFYCNKGERNQGCFNTSCTVSDTTGPVFCHA